MKTIKYKKLITIRRNCVSALLAMHKEANAGHIGSSLSCLDMLVYFYCHRMNSKDKIILSKGHAATALYAVLAEKGIIPREQLASFHKDATLLAAHPPTNGKLNGVIFGTGSLGHGLSLAVGIALSTKLSGIKFKVYCILSEGDCDEGSTWEAALLAGQHRLDNLYVIIDNNGLQAFGKTKDILDLKPLNKKWESFNFDVTTANNGNDFNNLEKSFAILDSKNSKKPKCIIAKTVKGNGISFMENRMEWHYQPMTDQQYEMAKQEIK